MVDRASVARWSVTDRGLTCRVRPTWVGTRTYRGTDGRPVRVLRRHAQVCSDGHLETMKRLTITRGHPKAGPAGREHLVFLSALAEPGTPAPWDPSVELRPHQEFFQGSVGDAISIVHVPGLGRVPELEATLSGRELLNDVASGLMEVSLGYVSWFVPAAEVLVDGQEVVAVGEWRNPETGEIEPFDLEALGNPNDPRVPEEMRPFLGGNHLAFGLGGANPGRGGPDVRMMLDAAGEPLATGRVVRAHALVRSIDESGISGTGAVAIVVDVPDGPAAAVWLTDTASATAYDSLDTFRAIHIQQHAEGANELRPLALGWPVGPAPLDATTPAEVQEPQTRGVPMPSETPQQQPAPQGDTPDYKAMYTAKVAELEELKRKYDELATAHQAMQAKLAETDAAKKSADEEAQAKLAEVATEKSAVEAKVDALIEELAPYRARELDDARRAGIAVLGATGELADKIGAAAADELPGVVVAAYYDARPAAAEAVPDLARKLKDRAWLQARFDGLREGAAGVSGTGRSAGASDNFAASFRGLKPAGDSDDKTPATTMQQRLAELQNGK